MYCWLLVGFTTIFASEIIWGMVSRLFRATLLKNIISDKPEAYSIDLYADLFVEKL
jgi:hypothetical protein